MTEKNTEILDSHLKVKKILKDLSIQDFKNFGLHQIVYIRHLENKGHIIFAADGQELYKADTIENALIKAKQEHLEPVIVH